MLTLIIFLLVLSLLVLVHELGHFVAAKKFGVKVHEFGFGFPPRIWAIKRGETEYSINWIPLGGFVRLKGETGDERHDVDSFSAQKFWKKMVILFAGIFMNFVLAWVLFTITFLVGVPQEFDPNLKNAQVNNPRVLIDQVLKDSPGDRAGLRVGDVLIILAGTTITQAKQVPELSKMSLDRELDLIIKRQGKLIDLKVRPVVLKETNRPGIGIAIADVVDVKYSWAQAPAEALKAVVNVTAGIFLTLRDLIVRIFKSSAGELGVAGPIGIAVLAKEAADEGVARFLQFAAILSVNLAVLNMLPFPALDGGRIAFLIVERLRRKSFGLNSERIFHLIGFMLLIALVVYITFKDIIRLGS